MIGSRSSIRNALYLDSSPRSLLRHWRRAFMSRMDTERDPEIAVKSRSQLHRPIRREPPMIATHWYKDFGSERHAWSRTALQGEMDFEGLTTAFPHPICILPGQSRDREYTVRIGRPAVDGHGKRAPCQAIPGSPRPPPPSLRGGGSTPVHSSIALGRTHSRMQPSTRGHCRTPRAWLQVSTEMVNCRRCPTARDLSLKNFAFGLMTDPGNPSPQTGE